MSERHGRDNPCAPLPAPAAGERWRPARPRWAGGALVGWLAAALPLAAGLAVGLSAGTANAQGPAPASAEAPPPESPLAEFEGRPIREIRLEGLERTDPQLVRNQLLSRGGRPLSLEAVALELNKLNRLGRFDSIDVSVVPLEDRTVVLVYRFGEARIVADVQVVGNREVTDQELASLVDIRRDVPLDRFQVDRAARAIEEYYREKGYYNVDVTVDEEELVETGIVLFVIREGERVRVTDIRFEGNASFSAGRLREELNTKEAWLLEPGPVDDEVLERDVASLVRFYRDRGYLDVRAGRTVRPSPNGKEAIITFVIEEGPVYTLRAVRAERADALGRPSGEPPRVFSPAQIAGLMTIKPGDVYSVREVTAAIEAVRDGYGKLGFVDTRVAPAELRADEGPFVDLLILIDEAPVDAEGEPVPVRTGQVVIKGNDITKNSVILRELTIRPDRPLDQTALAESRRRLRNTGLFEADSIKLTIQPERPAELGFDPGYRDVLVEVQETNTGSLSFGAAVSSDLGLFGLISLRQRNFDLADPPESIEELFTGRAFRGAGQDFELTLSPGTEVQNYSISLRDPSLLETDYSGNIGAFYRTQEFRQYDEDRYGARLGLGRAFGQRWSGGVAFRFESVDLRDIDADAPVDVFESEGQAFLVGTGFSLTRTTIDDRFRPTTGTRTEMFVEQVAGDYDFTKISAEHTFFVPLYESFLGRRTVLSVKTSASYIPQGTDEVPVYERYYLGGRSLRGFRYRTVSPKGIRNDTGTLGDDPVGGTWAFFAGLEVEQPVYKDMLAVVVGIDSGTVLDEVSLSQYRVSAGFGIRLYIPQLSQAPLAFDFFFPLAKEFGDEERVFSFSVDIPF